MSNYKCHFEWEIMQQLMDVGERQENKREHDRIMYCFRISDFHNYFFSILSHVYHFDFRTEFQYAYTHQFIIQTHTKSHAQWKS